MSTNSSPISVVVHGAAGRVGIEVVRAVSAAPDMTLAAAVDRVPQADAPALPDGVPYYTDIRHAIEHAVPDVVVDFTNAQFSARLVDAALEHGVRPVIGTSGISDEVLGRLRAGCAERQLGGVVAANFALGAVVLLHLAKIAARYFDYAEIIELHHAGKVDAPSGTALQTARDMRAARGSDFEYPEPELEHVPGARGAVEGGVGLHSIRLPGLVAHQEVLFGGQGQTLTLRHDSTGRDSFMPGVLLAVREVMQRDVLVEGLDTLIGLR